MTYNERDEILKDSEYLGKVRIALCDWLQYWATSGVDSIEDEQVKENTDLFIKLALSNTESYVIKLAILAISESAIKDAIEVTDTNVLTAVNHLLATALPYLL